MFFTSNIQELAVIDRALHVLERAIVLELLDGRPCLRLAVPLFDTPALLTALSQNCFNIYHSALSQGVCVYCAYSARGDLAVMSRVRVGDSRPCLRLAVPLVDPLCRVQVSCLLRVQGIG